MKQGVLLLSQLFLLLLLDNDLLHKCSFILASRIRLIVLIGLIFVCWRVILILELCPSVHLYICHVPVLYQNGLTYHHIFFNIVVV